ncbi:hypothetical protein [uncultured Corynebacterium sp.]|uniref:hypothetical protein n=1 Tax=uncultured Corynebacterium sp. TaxID=159447 RepID=UPI0025E5F29C|nr:hypothetical protein [uncultured Corynebacterium sp.]
MSNIDLYGELSLDRSLDSDEIDRRLAQQLAETPESDNARQDMLATSRAILGNSQRRAVYDNGLADPNSPDWTVRRLHSLASDQAFDSNSPVRPGSTTMQAEKGDSSAESTDKGTFANQWPQSYESPSSSTSPFNGNAASFGDGGNNSVGNNSQVGFQTNGFGNLQSQNGNDAFRQSTASSSVNMDLAKFAVSPERKRRESLMWTIGLGIIAIVWLYLGIRLLGFAFTSGSSSSGDGGWISELVDSANKANAALSVLTNIVFTLLHTIAMIVFLQLLWNIRVLLWKKDHKDDSQ